MTASVFTCFLLAHGRMNLALIISNNAYICGRLETKLYGEHAIPTMSYIKMARGKYLSLEEARKAKNLGRFAAEHPTEGGEAAFDRLLEKMAKTPSEGAQTSPG